MRRRITIIAAVVAMVQIVGGTTLSCRHHWARVRRQVESDDWSRCEPACVTIDCAHPDVTCPAILDTPEAAP